METAEPLILVRNLCKDYVTYKRGETLRETIKSLFVRRKVVVPAVKNVSFDIAAGEIVGLLGENGAGKSTIIKMLSGVLFPTSGQCRVLGYVPFDQRRKYVGHIGAVFGQKSQLIWDIPPLDSFALNKAVYGVSDSDYRARLDEMVDMLGLEGIVEKPTRVLSLGERMKCEFIMAMLHAPQVVFLDEPTIGVDIIAKEAIRDFIRRKNAEGVTFILTTHDLEDVERLAHRVIIINHGEVVFQDSLTALRHHLGDNKRVSIVMKNPITSPEQLNRKGIVLISRQSDREAEMLVDGAEMTMNELIATLSGMGEIQDVSIKEMGMDAIIQSIYNG